MNTRVYYGEYTLLHWIDLILKGNIELPEYQRSFVWKENDVLSLTKSLQDDLFVPPVTIGMFNTNNKKNYILDGQQRLTTLVLIYLGKFPKFDEFKIPETEHIADDNDIETDGDLIINWNINKLLALGNNKEEILRNLDLNKYNNLDMNLDDDFFAIKKLGFSYIVPNNLNQNQQIKFYASVFRNINISGRSLTKQESRKSLYFLDATFKDFFETNIGEYHVTLTSSKNKFDFVRYMAFLSNYEKCGQNKDLVASGFSSQSKIETFIVEYIHSVVNEEENKFVKFDNIFSGNNYRDDIHRLSQVISNIGIPIEFPSIIDMDVYFFGLLYFVLFKKKNIDINRKDELKAKIQILIDEFKGVEKHKKSPASLGYLRLRLAKSIEIYSNYVSD